MGLKDSWKNTGKSIGSAFANFGKAMGKTAKVVFTDDENKVDENGESELKKAWKDTGKGFGEAGKNVGHSAGDTAKKVVGEEILPDDAHDGLVGEEDKKEENDPTSTEGAVDAEFEKVEPEKEEEKKDD